MALNYGILSFSNLSINPNERFLNSVSKLSILLLAYIVLHWFLTEAFKYVDIHIGILRGAKGAFPPPPPPLKLVKV